MSLTDTRPEYYQFEEINFAIVRLFREARQREKKLASVLDLGCGRAGLGLEIERLGYTVSGIDRSSLACATARMRISEVIERDFTDLEGTAAVLDGRQFDFLLAADVLEHLAEPDSVLRFYRRFLKPGGRLIVSLPNVAVWDNRLRLLLGRFNYGDSGVPDRTHLRFFTFRTARELVLGSGFEPLRTSWEPGIARAFLPLFKRFVGHKAEPDAILKSPVYRFYSRYILPAERLICSVAPRLLAFRVIILARLSDSVEVRPNHQSQS